MKLRWEDMNEHTAHKHIRALAQSIEDKAEEVQIEKPLFAMVFMDRKGSVVPITNIPNGIFEDMIIKMAQRIMLLRMERN